MQLVNRQFFGLKRPQKIVFYDRHRHKVIVAGRRFGKTFLALLVLISSACRFRRSKNWYVAPTRTMAKDIAWEELKYLLNLDEFGLGNPLVRDVNETELTVTFINGAIIKLMGASEPDRLRGRGLKCVVLDEYADMDPQAWVVIRPQLSDKRHRLEYGELGRAMFIGTPKGYNHFKKLYDDIRQGMMGTDWSAYRFTSLDGGNIDSAEIEKAKYDLTERDFRQEYMATFESITGRVYHAFLREMYLESKEKMCGGNLCNELRDPGPGLPILVGMDFNVNPMTATLSSKVLMKRPWGEQHEMHTWKEYVIENSGTAQMMQAIREDFPGRHLLVFPDPTGVGRSTKTANIGETDHSIIRSFGADLFIPKFNTNSDKYNTVNGMMCNTLGIRRKLINPVACPHLVNSYDGYVYKAGTNLGDKTSGLDHITDADSYATIGAFPIVTHYTEMSQVSI